MLNKLLNIELDRSVLHTFKWVMLSLKPTYKSLKCQNMSEKK